jgi:hypothetical protein
MCVCVCSAGVRACCLSLYSTVSECVCLEMYVEIKGTLKINVTSHYNTKHINTHGYIDKIK